MHHDLETLLLLRNYKVLIPQPAMTSSSQHEYASEEEFTANKERIAHLYRILGLPLKDVMIIMERDHGFRATCVQTLKLIRFRGLIPR